MEPISIFIQFLIAIILGAIVGLEREINEKRTQEDKKTKKAILGLRTFSLTAGLGAISGFLYHDFVLFSFLTGIMIASLLLAFYAFDTLTHKDIGITTEIAYFYTYVCGFLLGSHAVPTQFVIAASVILVLLLSRKEHIQSIVGDIQKKELHAFISFCLLALVILPFLPDYRYSLSDIPFLKTILSSSSAQIQQLLQIEFFNPFSLWFIVLLVSGIDLVGYILGRTIGHKKGLLFTSIVAGFISSTTTSVAIAKESKEKKTPSFLLANAYFANATSFIPMFFFIASLSIPFLVQVIPFLICISLSLLGFGIYYLYLSQKTTQKHTFVPSQNEKIIDIPTAISFSVLFLFVTVISKLGLFFFGESGFIATTALGSLVGTDAVIINTATLAGSKISQDTAVLTFLVINTVNFAAKAFYSYAKGSKTYAFTFAKGLAVTLGINYLLFIFL